MQPTFLRDTIAAGLTALLLAGAGLAQNSERHQTEEFYRPYAQVSSGQAKTFEYRLQSGETLFDVAARFLGDPYKASTLQKLNKISDPLKVKAGDTIQVPRPKLGLQYSLQKLDGDDVRDVSPNYKFSPGDRFQLRLSANVDGYLYVFNRTAKGDIERLFPADDRKAARVRRFSEYQIPRSGWYQLDAARGSEELLVLVSIEPLNDLDSALMTQGVSGDAARHKVDSYFERGAAGKSIYIDDSEGDYPQASVVTVSPTEGTLVLAHKIPIQRK